MTKSRDTADSINRIDSSAADATAITIDANENVGIGTSPAQNLHIVDSGGTRAVIELQTGSTNQGFVQYVDSGQRVSIGLSAADDSAGANGGSIFTVDSQGRCGIGDVAQKTSYIFIAMRVKRVF